MPAAALHPRFFLSAAAPAVLKRFPAQAHFAPAPAAPFSVQKPALHPLGTHPRAAFSAHNFAFDAPRLKFAQYLRRYVVQAGFPVYAPLNFFPSFRRSQYFLLPNTGRKHLTAVIPYIIHHMASKSKALFCFPYNVNINKLAVLCSCFFGKPLFVVPERRTPYRNLYRRTSPLFSLLKM